MAQTETADEPLGWQVIEADSDWLHVVPHRDLKPHVVARDCWCGPKDDNGVIIHNSMDRREARERGEMRDV